MQTVSRCAGHWSRDKGRATPRAWGRKGTAPLERRRLEQAGLAAFCGSGVDYGRIRGVWELGEGEVKEEFGGQVNGEGHSAQGTAGAKG